MELSNAMQDYIQAGGRRDETWDGVARDLARLLAPFAPHLAEELWQRTGQEGLVAMTPWPTVDPGLLRRETVTIVVQVDGKLRDRLEMASGISEAEARDQALKSPNVRRALDSKEPARAIFVPDRLINLVSR